MLKTFETHKLFYGQYLYRLEIRNSLSVFFREKNLPLARSTLDSLHSLYDQGSPLCFNRGLRQINVSEIDFFNATKLYRIFSKAKKYKLRIQSSIMLVYSNDLTWINEIAKQISLDKVISLSKPNDDYKELLNSNTIIIEKDIGYNYKVTFGTGSGEPAFGKWAIANPNLIKLGAIASNEIINSGFVNGMYFYARDEKTLQLCSLMTTNIRRIDKLIVKPNIDK